MLKKGDCLEITALVTEDMLAVNVGSGDLRVLATPALAALAEKVAAKLASAGLDEGITTVGTALELNHTSPTPLGAEIIVKATLTKRGDRFFDFALEARDQRGSIMNGTHTRVSVKAENFQRKADEKFEV